MPWEVLIDDNGSYMDESARRRGGIYPTHGEAVAAARRIVDESLADLREPGMSDGQVLESYLWWGDDPFLVPHGEEWGGRPRFSARDYARERCLGGGGGGGAVS